MLLQCCVMRLPHKRFWLRRHGPLSSSTQRRCCALCLCLMCPCAFLAAGSFRHSSSLLWCGVEVFRNVCIQEVDVCGKSRLG